MNAARWTSMIVSFPYFTILPRPGPFCPMNEQSLHTCGFIVKSWDSGENGNVKRNHTKPKKIHCIFILDQRERTKGLTWCEYALSSFSFLGCMLTIYQFNNLKSGQILRIVNFWVALLLYVKTHNVFRLSEKVKCVDHQLITSEGRANLCKFLDGFHCSIPL